MDIKKLILGTIGGGIVGFFAGFLIFGLILGNYMTNNVAGKEEMSMLWMSVGTLMFAFLITYIFLKWANIKTAVSGAKAGATIALIAGLATNWSWHSMTDLFPGGCVATLVDAAGGALVWAIGGAAIGWILGRGEG